VTSGRRTVTDRVDALVIFDATGDLRADQRELVFAEAAGSDMRPYDRLIGAALDGDRWLFAREDTVETAWKVVEPVLAPGAVAVHQYPTASWGPKEADSVQPDGESWYDPAG
jgi:glucose-6-phosphate 1-dehydrogenase